MRTHTHTAMLSTFCLLAWMHFAPPLRAQTNFYDHVTRMWLNGQKQEVYCIATNRLAVASNDIAGLVLKMEYELALCDFNLTNTLAKAVAVGSNITTTNFVQLYPLLQLEASDLLVFLASYSTNCLAEDRAKASITNKPMTYRRFLKAIEDDGLLGN
ncbi:MAG: hypothetical protein ACOX5G_03045 [Kiritimatiellia bacterium]|jgi:hypothetical protein